MVDRNDELQWSFFRNRRSLLKTAAAAAALPFGARLAAAQEHSDKTIHPQFIQQHVVTGKKLASDFDALTGAKVPEQAIADSHTKWTEIIEG
ncbi:hypothetical protein [Oryzibacter oryziterrae]|uniref:hypothetical protein n=1 Tax=Oryzibacter oryziterrae TaxID=2766474 RepID=UPI001F165766|nr:hypothetical protein [Oryzibacter oryziterrae]